MPETRESKLDGIKDWLETQLGGEVHVYNDSARRVKCFRVEGLNVPIAPELHVTTESLDELGLDLGTILEDFDQQRVEERARGVPGLVLRWVYRLMIPSIVRRFRQGLRHPATR